MDRIIDHITDRVNATRVKLQGVLNLRLDNLANELAEYLRNAEADRVRDLTRESTNARPSEESIRQVDTVNKNNNNNNNSSSSPINSKQNSSSSSSNHNNDDNNETNQSNQNESQSQSVNSNTNQPATVSVPQVKVSTIKSEPKDRQVRPFVPKKDICNCPHYPRHSKRHDDTDAVKQEPDDQQEDNAHHQQNQQNQQQQQPLRIDKTGSKRPLGSDRNESSVQAVKAPRVSEKAVNKEILSTNSMKQQQQQRGQQHNNDRGQTESSVTTVPQCTPSTSGLNSNRALSTQSPSTSRASVQGSSSASHHASLMDEDEEEELQDSGDDSDEEYHASNDDDDDSSDDDSDEDSEADGQVGPRTVSQGQHRVHTGGRSYQCDQCDKSFTRLAHLTRHVRTHTRERPFGCRHCEMTFADVYTRNTHEQAIHLQVKPYRCKQCGLTATMKANIFQHIRVVHFGLPRTVKEQQELNIRDNRDPRELIEKV